MCICLICLIGLPASGKTTLVKSLIKYFSGDRSVPLYDNVKVVPVIYDDLIDWRDIGDEITWKDKRKCVYLKVENIFEKLIQDKKPETNNTASLIILDDNMYYRSMRYEYYKLARKFECSYCQIYMRATKEKVLEMNSIRDNPVPDEIIERMAEKLEEPNSDKFIWEERTLEINNFSIKFMKVLTDFILEALKNPIKQSVMEPKNYSQSNIHIADIALRRIVKAEIDKCIALQSNISQLATSLSKKRLLILSHIKSGFIELPEIDSRLAEATEHYTTFLLPFMLG